MTSGSNPIRTKPELAAHLAATTDVLQTKGIAIGDRIEKKGGLRHIISNSRTSMKFDDPISLRGNLEKAAKIVGFLSTILSIQAPLILDDTPITPEDYESPTANHLAEVLVDRDQEVRDAFEHVKPAFIASSIIGLLQDIQNLENEYIVNLGNDKSLQHLYDTHKNDLVAMAKASMAMIPRGDESRIEVEKEILAFERKTKKSGKFFGLGD